MTGVWTTEAGVCKNVPGSQRAGLSTESGCQSKPEQHYALARELSSSGKEDCSLLVAVILYNLRMAQWNDSAYDWTIEFDEQVKN